MKIFINFAKFLSLISLDVSNIRNYACFWQMLKYMYFWKKQIFPLMNQPAHRSMISVHGIGFITLSVNNRKPFLNKLFKLIKISKCNNFQCSPIWWCIFLPTQIRYTPLLTYAKSAILHIRPTSTWFYRYYMDLWPQRPAP